MKKPLNVFFEGMLVGRLTKKPDDTLSFQYAEPWLKEAQSFALSPALPLQPEEFDNRQTKAYFDNLLPEGETLKTFEKLRPRPDLGGNFLRDNSAMVSAVYDQAA